MAKSKLEKVVAVLNNPFETPVGRAAAEVRKLEAVRDKIIADRAQAELERDGCRRQLPGAEFDGLIAAAEGGVKAAATGEVGFATPAEAIAANIATAEATIARCDRMLPLTLEKLQTALADLRECEAQEIDKRADTKAEELAAHCRDVDAAMAKLVALEGSTFVATWSHQRQVIELVASMGNTIPPQMMPVAMPRSVRLAQDVAALREQVATIRRQVVRSSGRVSAYSLEELLLELQKPGLVAPSAAEVTTWFNALAPQAAKLAERNAAMQGSDGKKQVVFTLAWAGGKIDAKQSGVGSALMGEWRRRQSSAGSGEGAAYSGAS